MASASNVNASNPENQIASSLWTSFTRGVTSSFKSTFTHLDTVNKIALALFVIGLLCSLIKFPFGLAGLHISLGGFLLYIINSFNKREERLQQWMLKNLETKPQDSETN